MRKEEILSLTWEQVDMKSRFVKLFPDGTKDSEPRKVPICQGLLYTLQSIPRHINGDYVFMYKGKCVKDVRKGFIVACDKADISYGRYAANGFVSHDLRRTFNTNMRKDVVAESVIMKITGHSTREMIEGTIRLTQKTESMQLKSWGHF